MTNTVDQDLRPVLPEPVVTLSPQRQTDLDTYCTIVNIAAHERKNQEIANGSPFHARVLISKLFEIARRDVRIVTGELPDKTKEEIDVYGHAVVIQQARTFLQDPGATLTIIVQKGRIDCENENRFITALIRDEQRNGSINILLPEPGVLNDNIPHFMIADSAAYRFEPGKDLQPENETTTAIANFGDADFAKKLDRYFLSLVQHMRDLNQYRVFPFGPLDRDVNVLPHHAALLPA